MANGDSGAGYLANGEGGAVPFIGARAGEKGVIYRNIQELSEQEQQWVIEAVADLIGKTAQKYTAHNQRTNWGLIPVVDEYASGHGRDFSKEEIFQQFVYNHNKAMGPHYSFLGLLRKETPFFLPFDILGDLFGSVKWTGEPIDIEGVLKRLDDGDERFYKTLNQRFGPPPKDKGFSSKKIMSDVDKRLDDHFNKILAELQKEKGGYLTAKDIEKILNERNEEQKGYIDRRFQEIKDLMTGYTEPGAEIRTEHPSGEPYKGGPGITMGEASYPTEWMDNYVSKDTVSTYTAVLIYALKQISDVAKKLAGKGEGADGDGTTAENEHEEFMSVLGLDAAYGSRQNLPAGVLGIGKGQNGLIYVDFSRIFGTRLPKEFDKILEAIGYGPNNNN